MITLVKQETFKLLHKKSTYAVSATLLIIMTVFGVLTRNYPKYWGDPKGLFVTMFTGINWIVLFMIAACSSIIAMEFQYGTIKELLYRKYYRGQILVSKWITMLLYSIYFYVLAFVWSMLLKVVLFNSKFQLSDTYQPGHSVIDSMWLGIVGSFLTVTATASVAPTVTIIWSAE